MGARPGGRLAPGREPSRRLAAAPTRPCGPLCRPEAGVPSRPRASSQSGVRGFAALRAAEHTCLSTIWRSIYMVVARSLPFEGVATAVPCPQGVRAERGAIPTVGVSAAAALRAAVPTGGRRSKPSPRFFSVGDASRSRAAVVPLPSAGTCRDGSHPDDWGLRRRGPVGRCADQRSAFQAVPALLLGRRCAGFPGPLCRPCPQGVRAETGAIPTVGVFAAAALGAAVPTGGRRSKPSPRFCSVGDAGRSGAAAPPLPSGGTCRDGNHSSDWGLRRRGPAGRCADRRSAFQAVPAVLFSRRCAAFRGRCATLPLGVRAETGAIPTIGVFAAAALRAAVPTGGRRSKPSPRFCSVGEARGSRA